MDIKKGDSIKSSLSSNWYIVEKVLESGILCKNLNFTLHHDIIEYVEDEHGNLREYWHVRNT